MSAPKETRLESFLSRFSKPILWLLALVLLPVSFYGIENARGALAWRAMKKRLVAAGHRTDYREIIPSPVPDEQNFFKAPIVQAWLVQTNASGLEKSPAPRHPSTYLPTNFRTYSLAELKLLPKTSSPGNPKQPSLEMLEEWFKQWEPQFVELLAATKLPHSRLVGNLSDPSKVVFPNCEPLALVLASKTKVDLLSGRPQQAVQDLAIMQGLLSAMDAQPHFEHSSYVCGNLGGVYADTIRELLTERTLQDAELAELSRQMKAMEVFARFWRSLHEAGRLSGYRFMESVNRFELFREAARDPASTGRDILSTLSALGGRPMRGVGLMMNLGTFPSGWIAQNKVSLTRGYLLYFAAYDSKTRVFDVRARQAAEQYFKLPISGDHGPYSWMCNYANGGTFLLKSAAFNQVKIDQALIACALERYRLAKGRYPKTLEELTPTYLDKRPHDLFTGKDFIYQSEPTNSFKLYSVGYNGVDDKGNVGNPRDPREALDWVW